MIWLISAILLPVFALSLVIFEFVFSGGFTRQKIAHPLPAVANAIEAGSRMDESDFSLMLHVVAYNPAPQRSDRRASLTSVPTTRSLT